MHILLDEDIPRRLSEHLPGHEVSTVPRCGWSGVKNGKLLTLAPTGAERTARTDPDPTKVASAR
jgi:hypothetical protein